MRLIDIVKSKRDEILSLAAQYGARNIRLFGSVARGDSDPDSDIDFLVQLDPGVTLLKHAELVRKLRELLGCPVDVVSEHGLRERLRARVMQEAQPV